MKQHSQSYNSTLEGESFRHTSGNVFFRGKLIPSFRNFAIATALAIINCNINFDCNGVDLHVTPMTEMCNPCIIAYDYIIKLETFKEDMQILQEMFQLMKLNQTTSNGNQIKHRVTKHETTEMKKTSPKSLSKSKGKLNVVVNGSRLKKPSVEEFIHELNDLELDLIYTAYYDDFQLFGY